MDGRVEIGIVADAAGQQKFGSGHRHEKGLGPIGVFGEKSADSPAQFDPLRARHGHDSCHRIHPESGGYIQNLVADRHAQPR